MNITPLARRHTPETGGIRSSVVGRRLPVAGFRLRWRIALRVACLQWNAFVGSFGSSNLAAASLKAATSGDRPVL
jgi:hypothetical protein